MMLPKVNVLGRRHPVTIVHVLERHPGMWSRGDIIKAIALWAHQFGEPPRWVDWTPARSRAKGIPLKPGVAEGFWPTGRMVQGAFGSWNKGLAAAGFRPRPAHRPKSTNKER